MKRKMVRNIRACIKKGAPLAMSFAVITSMLSTIPITGAVAAEASTKTVTGSKLLSVDGNPDGYDPNDKTNPYGVTDEGKLAVAWNELSVTVQGADDDRDFINYYRGLQKDSGKSALGAFNTETAANDYGNNLVYARNAAFNGGTTRDRYVAYTGFSENDYCFHLYVFDSVTGKIVSDQTLTKDTTIFSSKEYGDWDYYRATGYLDIVAGDFDGDGQDSVIVAAGMRYHDEYSEKIRLFQFDGQNGQLSLTAVKDIFFAGTRKNWRTVSLAVGNLNHDSCEDLVYTVGGVGEPTKDDGRTIVSGFYGSQNWKLDGSIKSLEEYKIYEKNMTINAPGVDCGDVDGDGVDEIVVGGYQYVNEDGTLEAKKDQVLAVYDVSEEPASYGNLSRSIFSTKLGMNALMTRGFYTSDDMRPRAAVSCVAFNGQGKKEYIFFNGDIYDFDNYSSDNDNFSDTFHPGLFDTSELLINSSAVRNIYISDVETGNFDHNEYSREQIAFTVTYRHGTEEKYSHRVCLIGATFSTDTEASLAAAARPDFYGSNTGGTSIDKDGYILRNCDTYCYGKETTCHVLLAACDRDSDGMMLRYRGKDVVYSDPKIEAVLQAAPYIEGVSEPGSTTYEVTTIYGETDTTTTSLDWGVGYAGEFEGGALGKVKIGVEAGASFNYTWEFEKYWTESYTSSFSTTDKNTVLLQRTPIVMYNYDMWDGSKGEWVNNAIQVPMPLGPIWCQLSIEEYNEFVDAYDAMIKENRKELEPGMDYNPMKLYKIVDDPANVNDNGEYLIHNEGNPDNYLKSWKTGTSKLSKTNDFSLEYAGTIKSQTWEYESGTNEGGGFSGGFSLSVTIQGGVDIGAVKTLHGGYVSMDFMKGTAHYETNSDSNTVSGSVSDLNEKVLLSMGLDKRTIRAHNFNWSFGRWYIDLGNTAENQGIPVYGYKVSGLTLPPKPVEDLSIRYDIDKAEFTLAWEDPNASMHDGYYVYQIVQGSHDRVNATRIAKDSTGCSFLLEDLNAEGGNLYTFVVTSVEDITASPEQTQELESIWSDEVAYAVGLKGLDGKDGVDGKDGRDGVDGKDGADGKDGRDGVDGKDGADGKDGLDGVDGKDGADGKDGLDGIDGKDGADGKDGRDGIDGKDGADGKDGRDGINGKDGADGKDGLDGINGKDGADGKDGRDGIDGKDGLNGKDGFAGAAGAAGIAGRDGKDGKDGINGKDGRDGVDGKDGKDGRDGVGIKDITINEKGELIFAMSDGAEINAGLVPVSVQTSDGNVHVINTYSVEDAEQISPEIEKGADGGNTSDGQDAKKGGMAGKTGEKATGKAPLWLVLLVALLGAAVLGEGVWLVALSLKRNAK